MKTPREIALEYLEGIRSMDAPRVAALFAEDFKGTFPANPSFLLNGKQGILENNQKLFSSFDHLNVQLLHLVSDDQNVVLEMEDRGVKKNGEEFYLRLMVLFEINSSGIIQNAVIYDNSGVEALHKK